MLTTNSKTYCICLPYNGGIPARLTAMVQSCDSGVIFTFSYFCRAYTLPGSLRVLVKYYSLHQHHFYFHLLYHNQTQMSMKICLKMIFFTNINLFYLQQKLIQIINFVYRQYADTPLSSPFQILILQLAQENKGFDIGLLYFFVEYGMINMIRL